MQVGGRGTHFQTRTDVTRRKDVHWERPQVFADNGVTRSIIGRHRIGRENWCKNESRGGVEGEMVVRKKGSLWRCPDQCGSHVVFISLHSCHHMHVGSRHCPEQFRHTLAAWTFLSSSSRPLGYLSPGSNSIQTRSGMLRREHAGIASCAPCLLASMRLVQHTPFIKNQAESAGKTA
jgi:hypothetical protein